MCAIAPAIRPGVDTRRADTRSAQRKEVPRAARSSVGTRRSLRVPRPSQGAIAADIPP
jgi:hypothetical protein